MDAGEINTRRSRFVAGGAGQHLFLFCRWIAAIQHLYLWAGYFTHQLGRGRTAASGDRHWHRRGQPGAGISFAGKNRFRLVPLGSLGMTALGLCLAIPDLSFHAVLALLAALGFFGGFFIVPISALIQHRPEEDKKGGVIAAANWFSFVGIGAASGVYYAATHRLGLSPGGIFFWSALGTLAATAYVLYLLPDSLLRLLLWIATHTLYRLDVEG